MRISKICRLNVLFSLTIVASCSSNTEKETTMQASLYARYLQDTGELTAETVFLPNDTAHTAAPFDNIVFSGMPMERKEARGKGIRHQISLTPESRLNDGYFEFWNKDENHHKVRFEISSIDSFSFDGAINKKEGAMLHINASPFGENEALLLIFTNQANETASLSVPSMRGRTSVKFPKEALVSIYPGLNDVYLIRKKETKGQTGPLSYNLTFEFYSEAIQVEVTE